MPDLEDDYVPPAAEPIEWTPERAGAIVKAAGFVLHTADPLAQEPGAETLWKATEDDARDAGAPLARILNRYAPARQLAGVSDEAELAFAMLSYAKRNMAMRGQLVTAKRQREEAPETGPLFTPMPNEGSCGSAGPGGLTCTAAAGHEGPHGAYVAVPGGGSDVVTW